MEYVCCFARKAMFGDLHVLLLKNFMKYYRKQGDRNKET
jgi:hypothetical protein